MSLPQRDRLARSISPSLISRDGRVKGLHLEVSRIHRALTIIQCVSQPIFVIRRFLRTAGTEIDLGLDLRYMGFNLWQVALLLGRRHQSRHGYRSLEFRRCLPELHLRVHEGFRKFLSDIAHRLPWLVLFWVLRNKFLSTNPLRLVMLPPFGSSKQQSVYWFRRERDCPWYLVLNALSLILMCVFGYRGGHFFHRPSVSEDGMHSRLLLVIIGSFISWKN
jgi:hypothetical protein